MCVHYLSLQCWYYQYLYGFCITDAYKDQNHFLREVMPVCFVFHEDLIFTHFVGKEGVHGQGLLADRHFQSDMINNM